MLRDIGIPEKVISKLETILTQTNGNCALCGSAALAVHMKSADSTANLPVGDLDVVYTGSSDPAWVAQQLQPALKSPNSNSNTAHGQILLAKINTEGEGEFKIDLVPKQPQFATEFITINGIDVATLESLEKSYEMTARGHHGEKSQAARDKLEIISSIKPLLGSKQPAS